MSVVCPVTVPKVIESVVEGENNEKESTVEKTDSIPLVKEEAEMLDVKVETPELKVNNASIINSYICDRLCPMF